MSKNYFDLDVQGKKDLASKQVHKKSEYFGSASSTTVETTTEAPQPEPEVVEEAEEETASEEYPLNED